MTWQNIKDDWYGHWNTIRWRSGHVALMMGVTSMVMMLIMLLPFGKRINPDPLFMVGFFVVLGILLGWGFANTTLPTIKANKFVVRYRYKHFIDIDQHSLSDVADFIIKNKLFSGHFNAGNTTEARERGGKSIHEYRFVRLNDMMLLKMRF